MRAYHRVHVQLTKKDCKQIAGMLNKGWESARVLRRALILRELGQGQTAGQVASHVGVACKTVRAIARRYEEEGGESALYEKPRPGQRRGGGAGPGQAVIAFVWRPPPGGGPRPRFSGSALWCAARRGKAGRGGVCGSSPRKQ